MITAKRKKLMIQIVELKEKSRKRSETERGEKKASGPLGAQRVIMSRPAQIPQAWIAG